MLKLFDRAILPPLLFEQLIPQGLEEFDVTVALPLLGAEPLNFPAKRLLLGAEPFHLLSKPGEFVVG